jgi:hypothetical protein
MKGGVTTRVRLVFASIALALSFVLVAPASGSTVDGITPVCNPSWGNVTIPVCV